MIDRGYMQMRWNQQSSHGTKPAIWEKKRLPPVASAATTKAAQSSYPHSALRSAFSGPRTPATASRPMSANTTTSACPTTPRTAYATIVSWITARPCHRDTLRVPGWRNWSDAPDLKSGAFGHAGSSPAPGIALHCSGFGPCRGIAARGASRVGHPALPHGSRAIRAGVAVRRRLADGGRAAQLSRARADHERPAAAGRRPLADLPRIPRPALDRARTDEGRRPLRPRGVARRVRGARLVDDLEVCAAPSALRRREGRCALRRACAVVARARAADAPVHVGALRRHRPAGGHSRARHGDERADDGVDDGHVLDAEGVRRPRGRDRQADLDRRVRLPPR